MGTYDEMATIAANNSFLRRVEYCMKKAAIDVMAESSGTASHTERVAYANNILGGSASVPAYALSVVTNSTITASADISNNPDFGISDSDLDFTVNSMYNAMAGIST